MLFSPTTIMMTTQWCVLLLTVMESSTEAFTSLSSNNKCSTTTSSVSTSCTSFVAFATAKHNQKYKYKYGHQSFFLPHIMSSSNNNNNELEEQQGGTDPAADSSDPAGSSGMSFEDATAALKDQEDKEKSAARGAMLEEDTKKFQAKKSEFDSMRDRIRSRATDLNMQKSVATAESIKAATSRAQGLEDAATPTVDLSKFSNSLGGGDEEDPEDALTDEQKKEIDKVGQMSIIEQIGEELKNTQFPTPSATIKQALLMVVIFVVTAGVILKADEFLRYQITDWGFIPRTGEVIDYSDLSLPEGFTDSMTDTDLENL